MTKVHTDFVLVENLNPSLLETHSHTLFTHSCISLSACERGVDVGQNSLRTMQFLNRDKIDYHNNNNDDDNDNDMDDSDNKSEINVRSMMSERERNEDDDNDKSTSKT